ncbi:MAG: UPF0175 family protein [Treponema sp.]|jgi:hypothetical protein|nr:UPF0175 family protein [Treponema sp.]
MTAVTINLPDHWARYAAECDAVYPGWLEELVSFALEKTERDAASAPPELARALEIYKKGNASIAGAAKLAGADRFAFEKFLADIYYPVPQQTFEEVMADAADIGRMLEEKRRRAA